MQSYSLIDKLFGKPVSSTKEVMGMKVQYRILTNPERVQIWRKCPTTDVLATPEVIATPTLARAIVSIDGVVWSDFKEIQELKKEKPGATVEELVEEHLSKAYPFPVVNELYIAYIQVVDEFQAQLEKLKKSSADQSPEQSGKSVKSFDKTQQP